MTILPKEKQKGNRTDNSTAKKKEKHITLLPKGKKDK